MAKAAKKAAPKKGKSLPIYSSATHPLLIKPVGSWRLDVYLQPHGLGMLSQQLSLSGYGGEVGGQFSKFVEEKSLVLQFCQESESANLKNF